MDNLDDILSKNSDAKELFYHDRCDKYDYLIAAGCGAIAGIIDIFIVGMPGNSKLETWTDGQVDKAVMNFSKCCGWSPKDGKETSVASQCHLINHFPIKFTQTNKFDHIPQRREKRRGHKPRPHKSYLYSVHESYK